MTYTINFFKENQPFYSIINVPTRENIETYIRGYYNWNDITSVEVINEYNKELIYSHIK